MDKGLVLYQSKYGAAKKYAGWLAEASEFDCVSVKEADAERLRGYDTIVLAGGIYASGIAGLPFLAKNMDKLAGKRLAVFCVGASPYDEATFQAIRERNFRDKLSGLPCFYGRGAWDEEAMSFKDRTLCRLLMKAVAKKEPSSLQPWEKALAGAAGQKCDWTDRASLQPLLEWIKK